MAGVAKVNYSARMRRHRLLAVAAAVLLAGCTGSSGTTNDASRTSVSSAAAASVSRREYLDAAGPLLQAAGPLSDGRLVQLAESVCLEVSDKIGGDSNLAVFVQSIPENGTNGQISNEDASDFAELSVRWNCPQLYDAGQYINPGKYKSQPPRR